MPKQRKGSLRAVAGAATAGPPTSFPLVWIKRFVGVLLLPFCWITSAAFLNAFSTDVSESLNFIRSAPLWFFSIGALLWIISFFGLPRPIVLYVFGHEATHAVFVYLCGGKVTSFQVTRDGGQITTNRNNFLISLSPYFIPFYAVIVILVYGVLGLFIDVTSYYAGVLFWGQAGFSWSWVFYALVGFTWALHFTFTAWMITRDQPDLKQNGTFFSLVIIYLCNILVLSTLLILSAKSVTFQGFADAWLAKAADLLQ